MKYLKKNNLLSPVCLLLASGFSLGCIPKAEHDRIVCQTRESERSAATRRVAAAEQSANSRIAESEREAAKQIGAAKQAASAMRLERDNVMKRYNELVGTVSQQIEEAFAIGFERGKSSVNSLDIPSRPVILMVAAATGLLLIMACRHLKQRMIAMIQQQLDQRDPNSSSSDEDSDGEASYLNLS